MALRGGRQRPPRARTRSPRWRPDLAVIDISLKSSNGLELMKNLKIPAPKLPVLVKVSMHDEALYAEQPRAPRRRATS